MSARVFHSGSAYRPPADTFIAMIRTAEPRFFALGLLLVIAMVPTLFAMSVDQRQFLGVNVWDKPFKFEVALAVYVMTLAFFAQFLPSGVTTRRWYRIYTGAVIAAIVVEMVWIAGAAAMAIPSHFNQSPMGAVIYPLMGAAAVLLTSASMVYAVQIARNAETGLSSVVKEAVVIGLALVLPLTLVTAGTMSAGNGHFVGGVASDAGGLAVMGWARGGGDLRVAHFFATHALHFVPAAGVVSAWIWGGRARLPLRVVAALFVALVAFTFVQALSGRPFLPML